MGVSNSRVAAWHDCTTDGEAGVLADMKSTSLSIQTDRGTDSDTTWVQYSTSGNKNPRLVSTLVGADAKPASKAGRRQALMVFNWFYHEYQLLSRLTARLISAALLPTVAWNRGTRSRVWTKLQRSAHRRADAPGVTPPMPSGHRGCASSRGSTRVVSRPPHLLVMKQQRHELSQPLVRRLGVLAPKRAALHARNVARRLQSGATLHECVHAGCASGGRMPSATPRTD
jgi:hypothetical protein